MPCRSRRQLLRAGAAAALLGTAGCSELASGGGTPTLSPAPAPTDSPSPTPRPPIEGEWATYQRDAAHTGRNPAATELREAPAVRWRADAGAEGFQPVLTGNRLYVGGDGVTALDATAGEVAWRADVGLNPGIALLGDRVVASSTDPSTPTAGTATGADASVVALDPDGSLAWSVDTGEEWGFAPTTAGDRAYLWAGTSGELSADRYGLVSATFLAVERDGSVAWWRSFDVSGASFPNVLTVGEAVYVGDTRALFALDAATGELGWHYRSQPTEDNGTVTGFRVPTLVEGTLYAGGRAGASGAVVAVDAAAGERVWRTDLPEAPRAAVTVAGGRVYAGTHAGTVHALDAADGTPRWQARIGSDPVTAPTVVGDTAYVAGGSRLVALALGDGSERWAVDLPGRAASAPVAVGAALLANTEGPLVALGR